MFWTICFFLIGICLFIFSLQMYLKDREDVQQASLYGLACFVGFVLWCGALLYLLYVYQLRSFGLFDLLLIGCLFSLAGELFLDPVFHRNARRRGRRGIRITALILCFAALSAIRAFALPKGDPLPEEAADFQAVYDASCGAKAFAEAACMQSR